MFKLKHALMQESLDGGDGGGQGSQITPEVQALIDAQISAAVSGLKAKNNELLGKIRESGDALKRYEGIDPDAVKTILQRFSDDDEAKLIAAGKIDEVLTKRTERMKAGYEQETAKERMAREAAEKRAERFTRRVLENSIRTEAGAAGIHQGAVEDALFRASSLFSLDDEGNPTAGDGVFGKDGKPLTLKEWMAEMKEKAPHWWPASINGGGAQSGGGGNNGAKPGSLGGSREERLAAIKAMTKSV